MAFHFDGRVRFSEIGEDGKLTLPGVVDYFQDCSTFQSEGLGQGLKAVKERSRVWVLSFWQVVVSRYPKLGEEIVISTWPYEFRGFMGMRNYTIDSKDGEHLAWANSIWTNLDVEKGIPAKLTEEDTRGFDQFMEKKLDMNYAPRKIRIPAEGEELLPFPVRPHHLDTNHHVNNGRYIEMAWDLLPEGFMAKELRAEYKKQVWGDEFLYPCRTIDGDVVTIVLKDKEGNPCTIVEFKK